MNSTSFFKKKENERKNIGTKFQLHLSFDAPIKTYHQNDNT